MAYKRRASSRVIKKEKQRMVRQTLMFGGIALVVLLLFIFVVMPGFIRAINAFLDSGSPFEPTDTLPPQPPVLSVATEATTSARYTLSGYGEAGADLFVLHNSADKLETAIGDDGQFALDLVLDQGENTLQAFAVDAAGNESNLSRTYSISLDTQPPTIDLEQPKDGAEITGRENQDYEVKGSTEPRAQMFVNDRQIYTESSGNFSTRVRLNEGENELKFKSVDQAGNSTETSIKVTLKF